MNITTHNERSVCSAVDSNFSRHNVVYLKSETQSTTNGGRMRSCPPCTNDYGTIGFQNRYSTLVCLFFHKLIAHPARTLLTLYSAPQSFNFMITIRISFPQFLFCNLTSSFLVYAQAPSTMWSISGPSTSCLTFCSFVFAVWLHLNWR